MLFSHLVLVTKYHIRLVTIAVTQPFRSSAIEANRLLLITLIMVGNLAGLFNWDFLLTLTRLVLQVWQPVLGLPVLPIMGSSRYRRPVGVEQPHSWIFCLSCRAFARREKRGKLQRNTMGLQAKFCRLAMLLYCGLLSRLDG